MLIVAQATASVMSRPTIYFVRRAVEHTMREKEDLETGVQAASRFLDQYLEGTFWDSS
jgi:predicted DNA-binding protein